MNAVLQPITIRAIEPPRYRNEHVRDFRRWYASNEPTLSQYWDELGRACGFPEDGSDYFVWVVIQHERQLEAARIA